MLHRGFVVVLFSFFFVRGRVKVRQEDTDRLGREVVQLVRSTSGRSIPEIVRSLVRLNCIGNKSDVQCLGGFRTRKS